MGNSIHPSIFLIPNDCRFKETIIKIAESFIKEYGEFFKIADYNITIDNLIKFKPTFLKKQESKTKGNLISHPFVLSFIDLSNKSWDYYFDFLNQLKESQLIRDNEHSDFRFFNIIVRDLSRNSPSQLNDFEFFENFETFLKDNRSNPNLSLSNIYNIMVDNYNEISGDKIERDDFVFNQLSEQLNLLLITTGDIIINLNHSGLPTSSDSTSSVRYNSIGLSSVGFNQEIVAECISLKRKSDFLQEILSNKLNDDKCLEITRETQSFFIDNFESLESEVKDNALSRVSFESSLLSDFEDFNNQQKDCNRHLSNSELAGITNLFLRKIDLSVKPFKEKLKTTEEQAISYSRSKEQSLNNLIKIFTTKLFDSYNPKDSILAGIYGLKSLLEPQELHIVTQQETQPIETLHNKRSEISCRITEIPKEDTYDEQREEIKKSITDIDKRILQKYKVIKKIKKSIEIRWFSKNLVNLIGFPLLGLLSAVILFFTIPQFKIFNWEIIDIIDKTILSVISLIVFVAIGIFRAYILRKELKTEKQRLNTLTNQKETIIRSYINTYNIHFNLIIEKIKYQQTKNILDGIIGFIKLQIELINRFNDSLKSMQALYQTQYDDFDFAQDYFKKSIIGKSEVEYFCSKNKLSFFADKMLSTYFQEFIDNSRFFNPLRYGDITNAVSENEIIKANEETYKSNIHIYKEIEAFDTITFLSELKEERDILHSDVKQGELGDCYLLAALASIANKKPEYIRNIIDDSSNHPMIYFYDDLLQTHKMYIDKKFWVSIEVDNPIYAKFGSSLDNKREIWTMLIEKAWAKINGMDYTKINGDNRSGDIRKIDYSLALTGIKAIRENLMSDMDSQNTTQRIRNHISNKPVVLYSITDKYSNSHSDIITNHAYALIKIDGSKYEIYNPHGKYITIEESELKFNFDTVLYFDFNYQDDKHLLGLYSEYFIRNSDNNLIKEFDEVIKTDNTEKIFDKTFEETLSANIFNLMIDDEKKQSFTSQIIEASIPFIYLFNNSDNNYSVYFIGENKLLQENIKTELKKIGINTDEILTLNNDEKILGLLRLRNNLKLKNVTIKPSP